MTPLHRHQLVRLTADGWGRVLDRPWDAEARACLAHWAGQHLPLVVTRQATCGDAVGSEDIALGLAAPLRWARRRIALAVARRDVAWFDEFPLASQLAPALPSRCRDRWRRFCLQLSSFGATSRVYGGHGWQMLSGLTYVHRHSDIDVCTAVADVAHADAVAAVFERFDETGAPRLDGELLFPDGRAVAWREWQDWRAGRRRAVMVKTLCGVALVHSWPSHDVAAAAMELA